jgi:hypothetical protein
MGAEDLFVIDLGKCRDLANLEISRISESQSRKLFPFAIPTISNNEI